MIRVMTREDWPAVQAIYKAAVDNGRITFLAQCPDYEQFDRNHVADCRFVMEQDGKVVGWCALSPYCSKPAYYGVVEVSIYFDEAYRGKGLGTELMNHLITESEKAGYWSLYAVVITHNEASYRLHKKCGFRQIGYREKIARDPFGQWQDTYVFEKRSQTLI